MRKDVGDLVIGGEMQASDLPWVELEALNFLYSQANSLGIDANDICGDTESKIGLLKTFGYDTLMAKGGERPIEECPVWVVGQTFKRVYYEARAELTA